MIGLFLDGWPDELFYSICARTYDVYSPIRKDVFARMLFGERSITASPDFPGYLGAFAANLAPEFDLTVNEIISLHTLFPAYAPFLPRARRIRLVEMMERSNANGIHTLIGVNASRVPHPTNLRLCRSCLNADQAEFEEPYFHRVHQLPGVLVCPLHGEPLVNAPVKYSSKRLRYDFVSAYHVASATVASSLEVNDASRSALIHLSKEFLWLLTYGAKIDHDLADTNRIIKRLGYDHGYISWTGRINSKNLIADFLNFYSATSVLSLLNCTLDKDIADNWLIRLVRDNDQTQSPVQFILLANFFGISLESFFKTSSEISPFGQGPWPCLNKACEKYKTLAINEFNLSTSGSKSKPTAIFECECGFRYARKGPDRIEEARFKISYIVDFGHVWKRKLLELTQANAGLRAKARILGVDTNTINFQTEKLLYPKEVQRNGEETPLDQREKYRNAWLELLDQYAAESLSSVRARRPAIYAWLYRNDHEWLMETNSSVDREQAITAPRIDWDKRDGWLIIEVDAAALRLARIDPPIWLCPTAILRETGFQSMIEHNINKLPLTSQRLAELAETPEIYAIRRIESASRAFTAEGIKPKRWQLIRRAGVDRWKDTSLVSMTLDRLS
jgi:hypothetical protein